jgi:oxygen-independent coproporphyrinogen-3 oxidase
MSEILIGETASLMDHRVNSTVAPRAAYIHVPFCRRRCGYCNFTVVAGRDDLVDDYLRAVDIELSWLEHPRPIDTIFFGGGTPTQLSAAQLERLFRSTRKWFTLAEGFEFTVEANPADLTPDKLDVLLQSGMTRISLGVQSFDDTKLDRLERDHRRPDALRTIAQCRERFASVAIDLIFATPAERLETWEEDLRTAIETGPDHISTYALTFEKGAAFWGRRERGQLPAANEELERAMFDAAIDALTAAGYEHYEVSNFAHPGRRCRQNEAYWKGRGYFAVGPGASRYVDGFRETNHRSTTTYLRRVLAGQSPVAERDNLGREDRARERLVFQLRMTDGVGRREFARETGCEVDDLVGGLLPELIELGLLQDSGGQLRLTRDGLMLSDSLWPKFLES